MEDIKKPNEKDTEKKDVILNETDDDILESVDTMSVGDLMYGYTDNMPDDEIDNEIKLFTKLGRYLGEKDYDKIRVFVDTEGEYEPSSYSFAKKDTSAKTGKDGFEKYVIDDMKIAKDTRNGNTFLYFANDEDFEKYVEKVKEENKQYEGLELKTEAKDSDKNTRTYLNCDKTEDIGGHKRCSIDLVPGTKSNKKFDSKTHKITTESVYEYDENSDDDTALYDKLMFSELGRFLEKFGANPEVVTQYDRSDRVIKDLIYMIKASRRDRKFESKTRKITTESVDDWFVDAKDVRSTQKSSYVFYEPVWKKATFSGRDYDNLEDAIIDACVNGYDGITKCTVSYNIDGVPIPKDEHIPLEQAQAEVGISDVDVITFRSMEEQDAFGQEHPDYELGISEHLPVAYKVMYSTTESLELKTESVDDEENAEHITEELPIIKGATLLTADEVQQYVNYGSPLSTAYKYREYKDDWWIKGNVWWTSYFRFYATDASLVSGRDGELGRGWAGFDGYIRPALIIENGNIGDIFEFNGVEFVVISEDRAFCITDIGISPYRDLDDDTTDDSDFIDDPLSNYEKSDVKKIVDSWFNSGKVKVEKIVKKKNGKYTNRGKSGKEHGEFKTKKGARKQQKAMFANGYKGESLKNESYENTKYIVNHYKNLGFGPTEVEYFDNLEDALFSIDFEFDSHAEIINKETGISIDVSSEDELYDFDNFDNEGYYLFKISEKDFETPVDEAQLSFDITENKSLELKTEDVNPHEKVVIYKSLGDYYTTPESNYGKRISNARATHKMTGFNSANEIIDYYIKYGWADSKDDFIVIDDTAKSVGEALELKVESITDPEEPTEEFEDLTTDTDKKIADTVLKNVNDDNELSIKFDLVEFKNENDAYTMDIMSKDKVYFYTATTVSDSKLIDDYITSLTDNLKHQISVDALTGNEETIKQEEKELPKEKVEESLKEGLDDGEIDRLVKALQEKFDEVALSKSWGFETIQDVRDYLGPVIEYDTVTDNPEFNYRIEVRMESPTFDAQMEMSQELDEVLASMGYADSYFDSVTYGIIETYVKVKE